MTLVDTLNAMFDGHHADTTNGSKADAPHLARRQHVFASGLRRKGLALLDAMDRIDLVSLHATLTDLGLSDQLDRAVLKRLTDLLGPPVMTAAAGS